MLSRFVRLSTGHARGVLLLTLLIVLAAGAYGSSAVSHLSSGGFTNSSSPSTRADAVLASRFHEGAPNLVFLLHSRAGVDSTGARSVGVRLARELASQPSVTNVQSYWTEPIAARAGFVSNDGRYGLVTARVLGNDNAAPRLAGALARRYDGALGAVTVQAGGLTYTNYQINKQVSRDLSIAEEVAVPLTLIALVVVFGSIVAALLPLAVGGTAIIGTLAVLRLLSVFVAVSVYSLNLTTALGLGLAIDYSLFILSRHREELRKGGPRADAIAAAVRSAGRTVLFSSLTIGLSMAAMLVFPFYFLRSFAYAGIAVVAISVLGAVLVLPALLSLLGDRVSAWDVRPALRRLLHLASWQEGTAGGGFWRRLAMAVMRRPVLFGAAVVAVLVLLGSPFISVRFGLPDDRVLPVSATSHKVGDVLRNDFSEDNSDILTAVLPDVRSTTRAQLVSYAKRLSLVAGTGDVVSPVGTYASGSPIAPSSTPVQKGATYLTIENNMSPTSPAAANLVRTVRSLPAPAEALVTGQAPRYVDSLNSLLGVLPFALALIAAFSLVVLFRFTRSVLIPLKALVLNTLSLSATFGAMVWVFQEGHLSSVLGGVGATGYLTASMPVLMFCIAFGLSMDYEVFLLSRIKEAWDSSDHTAAANTAAVAKGLESTGRIVTAAAALVSIVFIAVATSQVSFIKLFGTGMALAVLMDATLVRGILVPAFMRLAGRANW